MNERVNDYSDWTFSPLTIYISVIPGMNELTSKITCNHEIIILITMTNQVQTIAKTRVMIIIEDKGSGNKEKSNGNNKVEIHTAKHLKSTEVEKKGHDKDKLNFKHHNDNTKSGDLHKNIHDLIKKKIKRVSERMFD